jgi:hypothetical protein
MGRRYERVLPPPTCDVRSQYDSVGSGPRHARITYPSVSLELW